MRHTATLVALLLLGGCAAEPPAVAVRVELAGGANPGVYTASANDPACVEGIVGRGSWAVQLTSWTGPKTGLRSLQLVVPAQDRPDELYLGLVFGDFFTGVVHEIETRPTSGVSRGRGVLGIDTTEDGATLIVTGSTADSVALTATIACARTQEKAGVTP
jgi:hypothetical protein